MKALILIAAMFAVPSAFGQTSTLPEPMRADTLDEQKPSIGLRTGIASTEGSEEEAWEYGVEAAYQPWIPVALAVELSGYVQDSNGPDPGMTRTKLLGKGLYNFGGTIPVVRHSYVGAGVGPVYDNVNNDQEWNLGFSPVAGFDIPLNRTADSRFSLGATVAYLIVTGDNPDALSANGTVKYWF